MNVNIAGHFLSLFIAFVFDQFLCYCVLFFLFLLANWLCYKLLSLSLRLSFFSCLIYLHGQNERCLFLQYVLQCDDDLVVTRLDCISNFRIVVSYNPRILLIADKGFDFSVYLYADRLHFDTTLICGRNFIGSDSFLFQDPSIDDSWGQCSRIL